MDIPSLVALTAGAKNLWELIDKIRDSAKGGEDQIPNELKEDLFGNASMAQNANAQLSGLLNAQPRPFIIRAGLDFDLPADTSKMQGAVNAFDTWDWTFVYSADNMPQATKDHLFELFCDQNEIGKFKTGISTTCMSFVKAPLPEEFQGGLYVAGITIGRGYGSLADLLPSELLPSIVITKPAKEDGYRMVSNPIMQNTYLQKFLGLRFVSKAYKPDAEIIISEPIDDEDDPRRDISESICKYLGIRVPKR